MADRVIRIRVTAVGDPSMRTVLNDFETDAARAYAKVNGLAKRSGKARADAANEAVRAEGRAGGPYRTSGRQRQETQNPGKQYDAHIRAFEKHEKDKDRIAEQHQRTRDRIRDNTFRKMQSDAEREERRQAGLGMSRRRLNVGTIHDFGRSVAAPLATGARAVMGGVGDVARGAGIDSSLGGLTGRVLSTEDAVRKATLSGMAGGPEAKIADANDVANTMTSVRSAADATRTSYNDMAVALENFTSKSSDLEGGKRVLEDMAKVAKASGVDLGELALGAGAISQSMSGYENSAEGAAKKSKDLMNIVRMLAKQGSMGSVEIKDLATYMPRLSASAGKFGGDYTTNIGQLGAVAQMAMKGGRSTAAEATNSAQALARDLSKRSNLKYLSSAGIDPFTDKSKTKLRSVEDIVTAVFAKTKGNQAEISSLFRNEMSRSAINAFSDTYLEAGGGEEGLKAIRAEFAKFTKTFSADEIDRGAQLAFDSKAGKAQAVQNRLETLAADTLDKIMPALERMAPHLDKVASGFASLVEWLATNPGDAIKIAIIGSIAKAGIGAAINGALTNYIMGGSKPGAGGAAGAPSGGGGALGTLGAGLTIAAAAVAITAAGVELIAAHYNEKDQDTTKRVEGEMKTQEDKTNLLTSTDPEVRAAAKTRLEARKAEVQKQLDMAAEHDQLPDQFRGTSGALNYITAGEYGTSFDKQDAVRDAYENRGRLRDELAEIDTALGRASAPKDTSDAVGLGLYGGGGDAFGGPGMNFITTNGKHPLAQADKDQSSGKLDALGAKVDALNASFKGGLRVTNLNEIKIPGKGKDQTGDGE